MQPCSWCTVVLGGGRAGGCVRLGSSEDWYLYIVLGFKKDRKGYAVYGKPEQHIHAKMGRSIHGRIVLGGKGLVLNTMADPICLALFVDKMVHILSISKELHLVEDKAMMKLHGPHV